MTKGKLSSGIVTIALCFMGTVSAVLYLPQSFNIVINLPLLAALCLVCCIIFYALLSTRIPNLLISLFVVIAVAGMVYFCRGALARELQVVLAALADAYDATFSWLSVPDVPEINTANFPYGSSSALFYDCTMFFIVISVFEAFLVCYALAVSQSSALAFLYTFPLFFLSVSASEEPPIITLAALLMFWLILIFSGGIRRYNAVLAAKISLCSVPAAAALLIIAAIVMPTSNEGFTKPVISIDMYHKVADFLNLEDSEKADISAFTASFSYGDLNLASAGKRSYTGATMLKVSGAPSGTLYLRAYSLGAYTRTRWEASYMSEQYPGLFAASLSAYIADAGAASSNTITIERAGDISNIMYLPYFSTATGIGNTNGGTGQTGVVNAPGSSVFTGEASYQAKYISYNFDSEKASVFQQNLLGLYDALSDLSLESLLETAQSSGIDTDGLSKDELILTVVNYNRYTTTTYESFALEQYTQLPESTRQGMLEIAQNAGINPSGLSRYEITQAAIEYIKKAAAYDLDTPKIPNDQDFVLYFLNESKQGYCVHFASSAVCMLRSLGVPARYVEGYAATVGDADTYTNVYDSDAHAWVEVYFEGFGWVPFEATPSSSGEDSSAQITAPETPSAAPLSPSSPPSEKPDTAPAPAEDDSPASALWLLLLIPAAALAVVARRQIILAQRRIKLTQKGANRTAIEVYLQFERLNIYEAQMPEQVKSLAQREKFSRQTISEAEANAVLEVLKTETASILVKQSPLKKTAFYLFHVLDHGLK